MKQIIKLTECNEKMLTKAMLYYRTRLSGLNRRLFNIPYDKLNKQHVLEFDGMEMIYASLALHAYGSMLLENGFAAESIKYYKYAIKIESMRLNFQQKHGPKVAYLKNG
jgi:hypothetical protein